MGTAHGGSTVGIHGDWYQRRLSHFNSNCSPLLLPGWKLLSLQEETDYLWHSGGACGVWWPTGNIPGNMVLKTGPCANLKTNKQKSSPNHGHLDRPVAGCCWFPGSVWSFWQEQAKLGFYLTWVSTKKLLYVTSTKICFFFKLLWQNNSVKWVWPSTFSLLSWQIYNHYTVLG